MLLVILSGGLVVVVVDQGTHQPELVVMAAIPVAAVLAVVQAMQSTRVLAAMVAADMSVS